MNENQVSSILAKYGVKRTGTGGAKALPAPVSMPAKEAGEQKNAILAKYGVTPSREGDIRAQAEKRTGQTTAEALLSHPSPAQGRAMLGVREPVRLPERKITPIPLPTPQGRDEEETLRQESRLRTQLAKGVAPETLGARQELREQRLQNLPAEELKARQEQALGHLKEAKAALADRERETMPYAARGGTAAGGLPYAAGASVGEQTAADKALYGELGKWQGIVNDLSARYYYRENEEKAAELAGDRAGQSRVQAVEDILADLRTLGEVAAGQYGGQRGREELMAKYGLSERELETQAPALIGRLQGELERAKEEAKAAGYDYDRMTGYQERKGQTARAIEGQKHTEEFAREHPALASAASILTSPVQGADYVAQLAKGYGHSDPAKLESYVPANVYEMRATNFVRNVRGTVARDLEEKYGWSIGDQNVASFLYQTGMSMGDFLFNAMLTGNFSGGLGGAGTQAAQKAASDLSLAIMGSGAAANTTAEAIERGLNNQQAFTLGAIAGVAEIITEKVSLETLLDKTALDRSARGYLLKNILAEGSEEVASDLINWAGDVLVAKDQSQWSQAIREYEAQGMGEKEAFELALKDQLISMAWSGLGGGLSGGVMAGGRIAINSAIDSYQNRGAQAGMETVQAEKTAPGEGAATLTPYSQNEAKNFLTGARNKVLGFGSDILEFARRAISTKGGNERLYCGKLPQETADMIFESTGRDLSDFNFVISSDGVWHAYERHGQDTEKSKGQQVSVRAEDMALLPEVIARPDRVFESSRKDGHGRTALIFEKAMGDTVVTITGISAGRKVLDFDSMRIMKERSPAASRADSTIDPSLTSKTNSGQTPLTDTILPQEGKDVKSQFAREGADYTGKQRPVLLPIAERQAPKLPPVAGESMMTEENWDSLMRSDTGLGARREAAAKPQAQKAAPVGGAIKADTTLFNRGILANLNQARKALIQFARANFPGVVQNVETGKAIKISRNGLDKFLSGRLPYEKYATGFHIPELVERAHKVGEAADVKGRAEILGYEYYETPITVDGKEYMAYIRVRETKSGDSYYGHTIGEVEDIKIEPSARVDTQNVSQPVYAIDGSTSDPIIPQTGDGVNREYAEGAAEYTEKKEVMQEQKTAPMEGTVKIDPGARRSIREQIAEMPSEDYQIPHISMPQEALVWEDGGNVPESKMPSVIRRYMSKLFKGKVLNVGKDHTVYIDKGGIEEYAFPAKRISGEIRAAKMTAGANLDTTLEPAQFLKNGADDGHHPEAKGGWDYFYVMFETDTGIYSGIVNTKITDRGRVFHDITEIQKESGPSTRGVNGETPPPAKTVPLSSDPIIPRAGDGVNREYAAGGAEYTEKPEVKRLPVAEKPEVKRLPKVEKAEAKDGDWESLAAQADALFPVPPEMDEANWDSLMRSDTGLGARREAAAKPKLQKADPVEGTVKVDTSRFDAGILSNLNKARDYLVAYARAHFPSAVVNAETGRKIGISRNGLDKFLSGRIAFEKYASGFHIPELIETAHKVAGAKNGHVEQAESIPTYEYYDSPLEIEGKEYMAHIRVRNTMMGDKYYGHTISEVEDIKIEPSARASVPAQPAVQSVYAIDGSTSDPIIPQTGDGVNREYAEGAAEYTGKKENPFIQTGTQGEFVDDRTAREKAMVEEAQRRRAAQPDAAPTYRMTAAMEKLGMEAPTRPITDAGMSESLRASSRAHYEAKKALDKVLRDTHADERARRVAKGIVDGIYTFADADRMGLDRRAMVDIVEAMELERSFNAKNIKAHQERTNWVFDGKVQELIRDAGNWKTPSLVSMNASTMQRTVERMMDPATAKAVNGEFFDPVLENEAKRIRFANRQLDKIRGYNLTAKESGAVQRLMEGKVTLDELRGQGYNTRKLGKASRVMAEMYATFYDAINDFLVAHGYEEIGWQRNYAPHMQEENLTKLQKYLQRLGLSAEVTELPTEIAGRTDAFRPGKQFDPFFQHRAGGEGDIKYDAVGGLESYINYMSNVLYHTDDIQKLRRLSEGIRSKFAEGYLREELDQLNDLQDQIVAGKDVKESWEGVQARKDKLYEELDKKTKLGGFVSVLDDYTNILAGKQSKVDRAIESFAGRRVLNWGRNIQNAFARSAVMGNLSSAINQTVQLPQLTAEVGPKYVLQAITDVAGGKVGDFCKESTFLTGKQGVQAVSALEGMEILYDKLSIPFEVVDDLASRIIVRAKYLQQVDQGMDHAAALKAADQYANRLVGSRMKGAKPIVFEQKNPITKLVTTFQLEVANGWEHIVHDLPMEIKETARTQGKAAAVGKTVKLAVAAELAAFIGNLLIKGITGREPVPFDGLGMLANYMASGYGMTKEDYMKAALTGEEMPEEFDVPAALDDAAEGVMDNVPYLSNITTLLGITDGRLPLPQIETEKLGGAAKDAWTAIFSKDEEEREEAAPRILPQAVGGIAGTAASFLPAGNQLKKTFRALPVLRRGGAYTGDGEEKLKYPVEQSPANIAKGLMFGTSALPETDAYYAEGKKTLSVKETRVYETLVEAGSDGQKVYDAMQELKGAKERIGKIDALLAFDGTRAEKEALFSGMVTQTLDEELGELEKLEIPFDTVLEAYKAQYGLEGDKDPKTGETVPLSLAKKKKAAVDRVLLGLTRKQREAVYKAMGISEKVWNEPRLPPRRK